MKVMKFPEQNYSYNKRPIYYYEDDNGCHICISHRRDRDGYPRIDRNGKEMQMSRYIYSITKGKLIPGLIICHSCDNPNCINPLHLDQDTQAENMRHMVEMGRNNSGKKELSEREREEIAVDKNRTIRQLASNYGVSHSTIINIRQRARIKNTLKRTASKPSVKSPGKRKDDKKKKD